MCPHADCGCGCGSCLWRPQRQNKSPILLPTQTIHRVARILFMPMHERLIEPDFPVKLIGHLCDGTVVKVQSAIIRAGGRAGGAHSLNLEWATVGTIAAFRCILTQTRSVCSAVTAEVSQQMRERKERYWCYLPKHKRKTWLYFKLQELLSVQPWGGAGFWYLNHLFLFIFF